MSDPVKLYMTKMPHSIEDNMSLAEAREIMKKNSCHHLPVFKDEALVGLISATDLKRFETIPNSGDFKIESVMSYNPVVVKPTDEVFKVSMLMYEKDIGSVIVSSDGYTPWGIFTSTDALGYLSKR